MSTQAEKTIEEAAALLLASTETLFEAIAEGMEPVLVAEVYSGREAAFHVFRDAVEAAGGPQLAPINAQARDALSRISSFDADLIAAGTALVEGLRDEKKELGRVRSAIGKHSVRERDQPRVVTIKA
ncbi:MAG: hypothetical protein AB8G23_23765 [Myxococcota bacterium]